MFSKKQFWIVLVLFLVLIFGFGFWGFWGLSKEWKGGKTMQEEKSLRELRLDLENELYEFFNNRHLKKDSKAQEEKAPASEASIDLERMAFDILTAGSRR
jgi:flagellar basal body-associated protein FliL